MKDDENCSWLRSEIIGVIKDENLPDWAREKVEIYEQSLSEDEGITMS